MKSLWVCTVAILSLPALLGAELEPRARLDDRHHEFFRQNCIACHGAEKQKGKLRLDQLPFSITNVETADRWQKVLNALNSGDMPPEDSKQPDKNAKVELLDDLANTLVVARKVLSDQGGQITMRRLNRREYKNTIRDLLGVDLDVSELPADGGAGTFDTVGSGLFMSSDQFEQYQALARQALDEAWLRFRSAPQHKKLHLEAEAGTVERVAKSLAERIDGHKRYESWTAEVDAAANRPENRETLENFRKAHPGSTKAIYLFWEKFRGAPSPTHFGFHDAIYADHLGLGQWDHDVPNQTAWLNRPETKSGIFISIYDNAVCPEFQFNVGSDWPPGDYVVRVRIAATDKAPQDRRFVEFGIRGGGGVFSRVSTHQVSGTMADPKTIEIPITIPATGGRSFYFTEIGLHDDFGDKALRIFNEAKQRNGVGPDFNLWIDWVEIEGPFPMRATPLAIETLKSLFNGDGQKFQAADVRGAIERFESCAFRGCAPSPAFVDRLMKVFEMRRASGESFELAIREILSIVLASPHFLYLSEPVDEKQSRELSSLELAARLSYFLWSAPPDEILLDLAMRGELKKPEVLSRQVDRLLENPKSFDFICGFTQQWLNLERLELFQFDTKLYSDFDKSTQAAAREEVFRALAYLMREDQSLTNLLKSDFVVVNGLLANYYGLDGVIGDEFRKVALPKDSPRGGLLGMAAILAMGSNGERTSPVERGAWVLRKLLNDPPPPAPANVPQISRLEGKLLTTRERMRAHQEEPQCASCHRKIDPIGFGLENFNAAGKWRTEDYFQSKNAGKKSWGVDPAGAFHNGPEFKNYFELRDLVAAKPEKFARGFTEALIEYALGRPYGFSDETLAKSIVQHAQRKDFACREFIHALVASTAFQRK